jgi:hypothetical protein
MNNGYKFALCAELQNKTAEFANNRVVWKIGANNTEYSCALNCQKDMHIF